MNWQTTSERHMIAPGNGFAGVERRNGTQTRRALTSHASRAAIRDEFGAARRIASRTNDPDTA